MSEINELLSIMNKLRNKKNGCPWDLKQSHKSLKPYLLEEAYEVIDAIEEEDDENLKKELGDLLLQIVFHSQLAKEENRFNFEDVAKAISDKLIIRHPHIFDENFANKDISAEEVKKNWELLKKEKEGKKRILDGIPKNFNALLRSLRIQEKVASVGFEWPDYNGTLEKLKEEIEELTQGIKNKDIENIEEEIGDVFFVLVNLSKRFNINPEDALQKSSNKFIKRFNYIEEKVESCGEKVQDKSLEELDIIWDEAKRNV